jgi:hypothetical protein
MPATGRLAIGFDDQRYDAQTFWADNTTIVFDQTQAEGAAATMTGNAATITPGIRQVGALGAASALGYIRNANSAVAAELVRRGPYAWDNMDLNNVVVDLGG